MDNLLGRLINRNPGQQTVHPTEPVEALKAKTAEVKAAINLTPEAPKQSEAISLIQAFAASCNGKDKCPACPKPQAALDIYTIREILENMPVANTAVDMKAYLLIGNGFEFYYDGDADNQETMTEKVKSFNVELNAFLNKRNQLNQINMNVLQTAVYEYSGLGHTGLRKVDGQDGMEIQNMPPEKWRAILTKSGKRGLKQVALYLVDEDCFDYSEVKGAEYHDKIDQAFGVILDEDGKLKGIDIDAMGDKTYYLLPSELVHLQLNSKDIYGVSPFMFDRLRIQLIMDAYKANLTDVSRDGFGKMVLKTKDDINVSKVFGIAKDLIKNKPSQAAEKVMNMLQLNNSNVAKGLLKPGSRDSVTTLNGSVYEDITVIPRSVKASEYFEQMSEAIIASAQAVGLDPYILGHRVGGLGNSGSEILDYTINKVLPTQQDFLASQLEDILKQAVGVKDPTIRLRLKPYDVSDAKQIAEIEGRIIQNARIMLGTGILSKDVEDYIEERLGIDLTEQEELRLFDRSLEVDLNSEIGSEEE